MSAIIATGNAPTSRQPSIVLPHAFKGSLHVGVQFAVPPGGRFVFPGNAPVEPVREVRLILNWFGELEAKMSSPKK